LADTPPPGYDSEESLTYEADGHYHIKIPVFYDNDTYTNHKVDFVFDTGAYITVMTRDTASVLGFLDSHTVKENVPLKGFSGECLADIKEIPGLFLGNRFFENVKVAVPHEATDINILGLNVIDHLKYFVDTEYDRICFILNPQPKVPQPFLCGSVRTVSSPAHVGD
jgi:clan AA aspartic protease (TIGR02281 family)